MSLVAIPEALGAAVADLARLRSSVRAASGHAVAPTTALVAAGSDEVPAAIAVKFGSHGRQWPPMVPRLCGFRRRADGQASFCQSPLDPVVSDMPTAFCSGSHFLFNHVAVQQVSQ